MLLQTCTTRRHLVGSSIVFFFWALLPLEDLQDPVVRTCTLGNWNPRPACGAAFNSAHPILSVFGLVPTRDEPAECLPWTRRKGARRYLPCPEMCMSTADSSWLMPQELKFCPIFGILSWLMPFRDRSGQRWQPSGKPYVVAATEVCSRFIGTCRQLGPFSPPPLPPFFLCFISGVMRKHNRPNLHETYTHACNLTTFTVEAQPYTRLKQTSRRSSTILPPLGEACVCNPWNHRDPFGLFLLHSCFPCVAGELGTL